MPTARRSRSSGKVRPPEDGCWPPKKSTSTSPAKLPCNTSGSVMRRPSRVWRTVPPTALADASESANCGTSLLFTRAFVKKPFTSTRPVSSTVRLAAGAGAEGGVCAASGRATAASETSNVARISCSWRFRYDYSKLQRLERNREQAIKTTPRMPDASGIRPARLGLGAKIFIAATLWVVGVLGVTLGLPSLVANRTADEAIRRALAGVRRGVQAFLAGRTATFAGMSAVSAEVPQFRERLLKASARSNVLDQAEQYRRLLHAAWVLITDGHRSEERRVGKECRSRWSPYH